MELRGQKAIVKASGEHRHKGGFLRALREEDPRSTIEQWQDNVTDLFKVMHAAKSLYLFLQHSNEAALRVGLELVACATTRKIIWWPDGWYDDNDQREWFRGVVKQCLSEVIRMKELPSAKQPSEEEEGLAAAADELSHNIGAVKDQAESIDTSATAENLSGDRSAVALKDRAERAEAALADAHEQREVAEQRCKDALELAASESAHAKVLEKAAEEARLELEQTTLTLQEERARLESRLEEAEHRIEACVEDSTQRGVQDSASNVDQTIVMKQRFEESQRKCQQLEDERARLASQLEEAQRRIEAGRLDDASEKRSNDVPVAAEQMVLKLQEAREQNDLMQEQLDVIHKECRRIEVERALLEQQLNKVQKQGKQKHLKDPEEVEAQQNHQASTSQAMQATNVICLSLQQQLEDMQNKCQRLESERAQLERQLEAAGGHFEADRATPPNEKLVEDVHMFPGEMSLESRKADEVKTADAGNTAALQKQVAVLQARCQRSEQEREELARQLQDTDAQAKVANRIDPKDVERSRENLQEAEQTIDEHVEHLTQIQREAKHTEEQLRQKLAYAEEKLAKAEHQLNIFEQVLQSSSSKSHERQPSAVLNHDRYVESGVHAREKLVPVEQDEISDVKKNHQDTAKLVVGCSSSTESSSLVGESDQKKRTAIQRAEFAEGRVEKAENQLARFSLQHEDRIRASETHSQITEDRAPDAAEHAEGPSRETGQAYHTQASGSRDATSQDNGMHVDFHDVGADAQSKEHSNANNHKHQVLMLRKEISSLKQECTESEDKRKRMLHVLEEVREQLRCVTELAHRHGCGKEVKQVLDQSEAVQALNNGEFTCFQRLYGDALRRMVARPQLPRQVPPGRTEAQHVDVKNPFDENLFDIQKAATANARSMLLPSRRGLTSPNLVPSSTIHDLDLASTRANTTEYSSSSQLSRSMTEPSLLSTHLPQHADELNFQADTTIFQAPSRRYTSSRFLKNTPPRNVLHGVGRLRADNGGLVATATGVRRIHGLPPPRHWQRKPLPWTPGWHSGDLSNLAVVSSAQVQGL